MTTPTAPKETALARKFKTQIDTGSTVVTWTNVLGIAEFKPNFSPTLQDDGVYDDEGWGSQAKTGLAWTVELKIVRKLDPDDVTDYDAGQEALRTKALAFGKTGRAHVRFYDRDGGPEAYEGYAEVTWAPDGGKRDDIETVSITLTGKGKLTDIDNPAATGVKPTVSGLDPSTGDDGGGTLVDIEGDHFTDATAVKFGTTAATDYIVISSTRIIATSPAGTAGDVNVTVTNSTGTSDTGTGNSFTYTSA